ncbi:MAG: type VI secretion system tip protein TssI/VgrG [Pseudomonadota bacterium]
MAAELEFKNRQITMKGPLAAHEMQIKNARVVEGLSTLTEITVEFLSSNYEIDLQDVLGRNTGIAIDIKDDKKRHFSGFCVSAEYVGLYQGQAHFVAELRPWLWFLTRSENNRIYQDKSVVDIITDILGDYGFSSDIQNKLTGSYVKRDYCVQYAETDFAFISRLMEEEGIYYFFEYSAQGQKIVLADSISAHVAVDAPQPIQFFFKEESYRRADDHIFDWVGSTAVQTGKVTLNDYDFLKPRADQKKVKAIPKGKHNRKNYEKYIYPGHVRPPSNTDAFARVRMEAEAVKHKLQRGVCNVRAMEVGRTFTMAGHERSSENAEYLVVKATHMLQIETDYEDEETSKPLFDSRVQVDEDNKDTYRCNFDVIAKKEPFRAPFTTPWPQVPGLQTAVVTGPPGEDIYTDEHGRIKVQFHWDRDGKQDENTTCWVRCVMPWTGKNWGMISVPRIGNEVVIQFEEGDPDKPICTGMIYNGENKPPFALPANKTQSGIVTRSSKQGSANTFNELVFEDKMAEEFVRFQSERDYFQTIKNDATITVGLEHQDNGDLTQTIHRHKTETLNTGNHSFTVKDGTQTIKVKKDHTETIEGKSTQTVTANYTQTVTQGDYKQTIKMGNLTREVSMGSQKETIKMGNYALSTNLGSITEKAMQKIEMKVGANSITIDQTGVTIKGLMIKIQGTAMIEAKAPMSTVKGDAMLILKGGLTMIN